jgi:hypothetical protein
MAKFKNPKKLAMNNQGINFNKLSRFKKLLKTSIPNKYKIIQGVSRQPKNQY